jgi:hypothetical protein
MTINNNPTHIAPQRASRNLPPGHRVLHVTVPEDVFNAAKAQALLMGIAWPQFVVELLRQADPRKADSLPLQLESTPATS